MIAEERLSVQLAYRLLDATRSGYYAAAEERGGDLRLPDDGRAVCVLASESTDAATQCVLRCTTRPLPKVTCWLQSGGLTVFDGLVNTVTPLVKVEA